MNKHFLPILLSLMDSIQNENTCSWLNGQITASMRGEFLEKLWNDPEEVCKQKTAIVNLVNGIKEALEIDCNPEVHRLAAEDVINRVERFYWKKTSGVVQDFMSEDDFVLNLTEDPWLNNKGQQTWVTWSKVYEPGQDKPWFMQGKNKVEQYKRKKTWEMTPETSYRFMAQNPCTSIKQVKMGFAQLVAFHSDNNAMETFRKENGLDTIPSEMKHLFVALRKGDKVEDALLNKWKYCRSIENATFLLFFAHKVNVQLDINDIESLMVKSAFDIGYFKQYLENQQFVKNVFELYCNVQPFFTKTDWADISAEGRKDFAGSMKRLAKAISSAEAAQEKLLEEFTENTDFVAAVVDVSTMIEKIKIDMLKHWNVLTIKSANLSIKDESFYSLQKKLIINVKKVLGVEVLNIEESMQGNAFQGADVLGKIYPGFKESTFSCSIDIEKSVDADKGWALVAQACKKLQIIPVGGSVFAKLFDKDGNPSMPTLLADAMFDNFSSFIAYFNSLTNAPAKAALCNSEMHLPMNDACSVVIYNAKADIIGETVRDAVAEKLKKASSRFTDKIKIFPSLLAGVDGSGLNSTGVKAQIRGFVEGAEKHESSIPKDAAYFKGLSVDGFICEFDGNSLYTIWHAIADGHVSVLDSKEEWFAFVRDNDCKPVFAIEKGMVKGYAKAHLGKILGGDDISIGEVLDTNGGFVKVDRTTYGWSILPCPLGTGTSSSFQLQVMLKADPLHFMYLSKQVIKEGLLDRIEAGTPEYKATSRMLRNMVEIYQSPADLEKELRTRFYKRYVGKHSAVSAWINNIVKFFEVNSVKLQDHLTNRFYRKVESTGNEVKDRALLNLIDKVVKDPNVNGTVKGALRPWLENPSKYLWRMASTGLDKKYDWRRLVMADFASSQAFKSFAKGLDEGAKAWLEKALNFSGLTIATSSHNSLKPELAAGWRGPLLVKDAVQLNMVIHPETLRAWVKGEKIFVSADEDPIDLIEYIRPHMEAKHGTYDQGQLETMLFNLYVNSMVLNLDEKIMLMHVEDVEDGQGDDDGDTWCLEFDKDIVRLFAASIKRWRKYHPNKVSIELSKKAQIDYSDAFSADEDVKNKAIERYGFEMPSLGGRVANPLGWNYSYLRENLNALMQDPHLADFAKFLRKVGVNPQGPAVGPFSNISVDIMSRVDVEKLGQDDEKNNLLFQGYKTSAFGVQISIDFAKRMVEILNAMLYGLKKDGKFVVDFDKEITAEFLEEWGCGNQEPKYNVACVTKDAVTKYYFVGKFEIPQGYTCENYLSEEAFKKLAKEDGVEAELEMRTSGSVLCPDTKCFDFNFCYHFAQVAMQLDKDSVCIWKESPMAILKNKELQEKVRVQLGTMMPNKFTQNFGIFMSLLEDESFVSKVNITETLMSSFKGKNLSENGKAEGLLNRLRVSYAKMMAEESTPWGDKKKISSTAKSLRLLDAYFGGLDREARREILADPEKVCVIVKDLMILDQYPDLEDAPKQLLWQVIVEGHVEIVSEEEPSETLAKQSKVIEATVAVIIEASLQGFYSGKSDYIYSNVITNKAKWLLQGKAFDDSDLANHLEREPFVTRHSESNNLMFADMSGAGRNHVLLLQSTLRYMRKLIVETQVNDLERESSNAIKAFNEVLDYCDGDLFGAFRTYNMEYKKCFIKLQSLLRLIPHYIPTVSKVWFEYIDGSYIHAYPRKYIEMGVNYLHIVNKLDYRWFISSQWFKPEAWMKKALMGTPEMPATFEGFNELFEYCGKNGITVVSKSYFNNDGLKTPDILLMTALFNRGELIAQLGSNPMLQLRQKPQYTELNEETVKNFKTVVEYIRVAGVPVIEKLSSIMGKDPLSMHAGIVNRMPLCYHTNTVNFTAWVEDESGKKTPKVLDLNGFDSRHVFKMMLLSTVKVENVKYKKQGLLDKFKTCLRLSILASMCGGVSISKLPSLTLEGNSEERQSLLLNHVHSRGLDDKLVYYRGNKDQKINFLGKPFEAFVDGTFRWDNQAIATLKSFLNYTQLFSHEKTIWDKEMMTPLFKKAVMPAGHFQKVYKAELQGFQFDNLVVAWKSIDSNQAAKKLTSLWNQLSFGRTGSWTLNNYLDSRNARNQGFLSVDSESIIVVITAKNGSCKLEKQNGPYKLFGNDNAAITYFRTHGGNFRVTAENSVVLVMKKADFRYPVIG